MATKTKTLLLLGYFSDFAFSNSRSPLVLQSSMFQVLILATLKAWIPRQACFSDFQISNLKFSRVFTVYYNYYNFIMPKGNPIGSKLSVIKKKASKKRKGFQGTPKWSKDKKDLEPKNSLEITFVNDDTIGGDELSSTQESASKRKIATVDSSDSEEEYKVKEEYVPEGYRIIYLDSLREIMQRVHDFSGHCQGTVQVLEDPLNCFGLCSTLTINCEDCEMCEFFSTGKHTLTDAVPRTIQGKDVNRRAVFACNEVGLGREGLSAICEIFNMPPPVAPNAWSAHDAALYDQHIVAINEELARNQDEVKDERNKDEGYPTPITVSFDGTWSKRGFTSNHGVGIAIATQTGKVLDYAVESKVCHACCIQQKKLTEEEFEEWFESHSCTGEYKGSSPSMEKACAKKIWDRSVERDLEYKYMVSDGDSKAYDEVYKTYGICEVCEKDEEMNKSDKKSDRYINWIESDEYKQYIDSHISDESECHKVQKLDCVGHVQKRLGKALRELQKSKGKLPDDKPIGGKSGRLTKTAVEKLQKYYGNAIRNNVKTGNLSPEERKIAVFQMKNEIKAGLYHSCKLPDKERHQYCPATWCAYKKSGGRRPIENKNHHLDPVFIEYLKPVYDRLTNDSLLERCLPGHTQNPNECLNSLIWARCPKIKWFGRKRVEMAAISAILQFSSGATAKHRIMELAGIPAGSLTYDLSLRRDNLRVKKANQRSTEKAKKIRRAKRRNAIRVEESKTQKEGVTYEAGGF